MALPEAVDTYVKEIQFKKKTIGGIDEEDALIHMRELSLLFQAELDKEIRVKEELQEMLTAAQEAKADASRILSAAETENEELKEKLSKEEELVQQLREELDGKNLEAQQLRQKLEEAESEKSGLIEKFKKVAAKPAESGKRTSGNAVWKSGAQTSEGPVIHIKDRKKAVEALAIQNQSHAEEEKKRPDLAGVIKNGIGGIGERIRNIRQ